MSAPLVGSTSPPAAGTYFTSDTIQVLISFDQQVYVTGSPTVECSILSGTIAFDYTSGSGTSTLTFSYQVQAGDDGSDGINPTFQFVLNGGTIKNIGAEDASLSPMVNSGLQWVILNSTTSCALEGEASTLTVTKGVPFSYRLYSRVGGIYQASITWNPSVSIRLADPLATPPLVPYLFDNTDASSVGHLFTGLVFNSVGVRSLDFISPDLNGKNVRYSATVTVGTTATKITATVVRRSLRTTQIALSATNAAGDVDFSNTASVTITSSNPAFVNTDATSDTESFVAGQMLITVSSATANTLTFAAPGLTSATVTIV